MKKHLPFNPRTMALGPIQYTIGTWDSCCFGANYALLGYDFLRHFDLILDYPHGRIFMVPNKNLFHAAGVSSVRKRTSTYSHMAGQFAAAVRASRAATGTRCRWPQRRRAKLRQSIG